MTSTCPDEIKRVCVVSTGVIGSSWVAYYLARGLQVIATDPAPGAEGSLRATVARLWPALEPTAAVQLGAAGERLAFDADLTTAALGTDFVQENGPENEQFKIRMFSRLDQLLPPSVILASSSSGLSVSRIQSECMHPERVVIGHPFNPPHLIPLVEVVGGAATSEITIERVTAFYTVIGKKVIRVGSEMKGHIANRLQAALWREAFHLVGQGVASVADIDEALTQGPGLRWASVGPFMGLHLSGGAGGIEHVLNHLGPNIESWWADLGSPHLTEQLKSTVIREMAELAANRDFDVIARGRDQLVLEILAARARLNPEPH